MDAAELRVAAQRASDIVSRMCCKDKKKIRTKVFKTQKWEFYDTCEMHDEGHREAMRIGVKVRAQGQRYSRLQETAGRGLFQTEDVGSGGQQYRHRGSFSKGCNASRRYLREKGGDKSRTNCSSRHTCSR
jgi:hypothetical protein